MIETEKVRSIERVKVRLHQRKIKGEVSDEVKELARKEGIILKEGHTLVREHKRRMEKVNRINYKVNPQPPTTKKARIEKVEKNNNVLELDWD